MKTHTSNFKDEIKKFGREIDSKITYGTTELGKEQLNSVTPHYESSLLKSVMKQLDVDSNVEIPLETVINYQFGVKVGNSYEYLNYGNYVVYKTEKQEDTKSWKITCYDKMLYAMKDYESLGITYPITVKNYLSAICTKLGLTLASDDFVNANKEITSELYLDSEGNSLGYTYRDVLDEIAQVTASCICINDNDELEVRYISNAGKYETQIGTNIHIDNVDDANDFNYELQGNTIQDGTPTPDNPIEVQTVTGRQEITINEQSYEIWLDNNLFDKTDYRNNTRIRTNGGNYDENGCFTSKYIKVEPNTTYVKNSPILDGYHRVAFYTGQTTDTFISKIDNSNTFTTPETCEYLRFCGYLTEVDTAQLLKQNQERKIIELCKIGNYQDKIYKQNNKWYIEKNIGKIILNGSETITTVTNTDTYYGFRITVDDAIMTKNFNIDNPIIISDKFKIISYSDFYNSRDEGISRYNNNTGNANQRIYISILKSRLTYVTTWASASSDWLQSNNVLVYYAMQTPTTTEITDTELINQLNAIELFEGENNITITSSYLPSLLKIIYFKYETIDEEQLKDVNVNFGEKFGPVNSLVLSRSAESDNIYRKDDESIEENGLTEIKIKDNQILNGNNRDEFIDGIFDKLRGLEYYVNDYVSTGIAYLELGDFYKVKVEDNSYKCLMLNDELDVTQGLEEPIHAERMKDSETDYKNASKTDRTINQAYIIVKKNEAEIEELASKVVDVSNTISGIGSITLDNAYKGILHRLEISGNISSLMPSNTLTPSATLKPIGIYVVVDEESYLLDLDYLIYNNAEEHDTFVYEDGKCWIERINGTIEEKEPITILVDKNSDISIEPFTDTHLFCEYLLDNKYTSTFANQVEVSSELNLLADTIEAKVSQVADDDGNVTSASIILAVNNDSSSATIDAEKISLQGKEINLTSDDVIIKSNYFNVDKNGNMSCNNATMRNATIDNGNINITSNYYNPKMILTGISYGGAQSTNELNADGFKILVDGSVDDLGCANLRAVGYYSEYPFTTPDYYGGRLTLRDSNSTKYADMSCYGYWTGTGTGSPNAYMSYDGEVNARTYSGGSLESIKKNIKLYNKSATDIIKNADIYEYNLKTEDDKVNKHYGLVISDSKNKYNTPKEIISKNGDGVDLYSMISLSWKAIRELTEQNEKLQQEIEQLRKEIK